MCYKYKITHAIFSIAILLCVLVAYYLLTAQPPFSTLYASSRLTEDTAVLCAQVSEIPQVECQALLDLYNSTNGIHWSNQTNWLTTMTPCTWYGIGCASGHVVNVNMPNNGLQGTLPATLGNLTNLHWLILPRNRLTGSIPTTMGDLVQMESIDLLGNQLIGAIPPSLGALSNLVMLSLEENQLDGSLPAELGSLSKLEKLYLGHNRLTGNIPSEFGQLNNIREITIHDNLLTGNLPSELGNLTQLTILSLWINQLHGNIPASLGNLEQLQVLALSDNQLSGTIPPDLGRLIALRELNLSNNQLTGTIPSALGTMLNLQDLYLSRNRLAGQIPVSLGNLVNLRRFTLYENQLNGAIPSELGNLVALEELDLGNAGLQGVIPTSLSSLSELRKLLLWSNQLQGEIPSWLGNLSKLNVLGISENQLTGGIPTSLGRLSNLSELYLSHNRLSGNIPVSLGDLTSMITLTLDNNQLSGPIPIELGQLTNLQLLQLGSNQLSGTIPAELGNLRKLKTLVLWTNQLSGAIPATLGNLTQLQHLGASDNRLTGALPSELGKLTALQELNFSNNQLTGTLPAELGKLVNLQYLHLNGNHITGQIPAQLGNLSQLRTLHLGENNLTGALPSELGNLSNLELLVVWNNALTGTLPDSLAKLSNLQELSLNDNALQGTLPAGLGNLTKLQRLNLGENQLTGSIPSSFGNLTNLRRLHLNHNQLSGSLPPELGNLSQLEHLILWVNQISGPIPASLGNLTKLTILGLSENAFTGTIPSDLSKLSSLVELHLHTNRLIGTLPGSLGNLASLQTLYLYHNAFSGEIPASWINLTQLSVFNLRYNMLIASNPTVASFVTGKDASGLTTQTVAPSHPQVQSLNSQMVRFAWMPIPYQLDGGGYQVSYGTTSGGPYPFQIAISNKATDRFNIGGLTPDETYFFVLRTHTPAHSAQVNDLWSSDSIEVSVKMPIAPPPDVSDESESCTDASPISMDGVAHAFAFQVANDQDWLRFEAQKDVAYRIEAQVPPGSPADVVMDLFEQCEEAPTAGWNKDFTLGGRMIITARQSAPIYLRIKNHNSVVAGTHVRYAISVQEISATRTGGALIIVEGRRKFNDSIQPNIYAITNRVYHLFQENGYTNDDIYYLAVESPNRPGIDTTSSVENLRFAITTWAKAHLGDHRTLTLYLIDHGDQNRLYLDGTQQQHISPDDLGNWLEQLESTIPDLKINLIIESCYAGSFISNRLSKTGRVIITSTSSDALAWVSKDGVNFSDQLLTSLSQGMNLALSFQSAFDASRRANIYQEPWIDANGNHIPNEIEDIMMAAQRGFAAPGTLGETPSESSDRWPPFIVQDQPIRRNHEVNNLSVSVFDNDKVASVWAVIYPPSYTPPAESDALVQESVTTIQLLDQGNGLYSAIYPDFSEAGTYRIVVYATDNDGLNAQPYSIEIESNVEAENGQVYLPLVTR